MDVQDWEAVVRPWGKLRKRPCVSPLYLLFLFLDSCCWVCGVGLGVGVGFF